MKQYIFIILLLAFAACSSNNEGLDSPQDPEGTREAKMLYSDIQGIRIGYANFLRINHSNQFWVSGDDTWRFISVGPVDGLADITSIPKSGWTKEEYVTPGNGYVVVQANGYESIFARIYAVEYIKEGNKTLGVKVKLQDYFNGDETKIGLSAKSVVLDKENLTSSGLYNADDIYLNNVSCKIESNMDYTPSLSFQDSRLALRVYRRGQATIEKPVLKITSKGLQTEELSVTP